ncbi:hypothetical protein PanWU01x14_348220 [Parasponia andersonii]|uniref:Uncharacterized protein n=1 Tax=Parasponia andersonii TaxID=3476 RepID=A0A2P5ABU6_PARAD|nr:hypothetical protein PanWU01x14_348220 [Parasponia andersonii]
MDEKRRWNKIYGMAAPQGGTAVPLGSNLDTATPPLQPNYTSASKIQALLCPDMSRAYFDGLDPFILSIQWLRFDLILSVLKLT